MTADRFIPEIIEVTIAASGTTSSAVNLSGLQLVAVKCPAALTGSALTFSACESIDGTFNTVKWNEGANTYSLTMAAGDWIPVEVKVFAGVPFLKIISGSTEAADRTFKLICRPVS